MLPMTRRPQPALADPRPASLNSHTKYKDIKRVYSVFQLPFNQQP